MVSPLFIDDTHVDQETLTRVINDVSRLTGAKITVRLRTQWVVECENYPVSLALQTILCGAPSTPSKHANKPSDKSKSYVYSAGGEKAAQTYQANAEKLKTDDPPGGYQPEPAGSKQIRAWVVYDKDEFEIDRITVDEKNRRLAAGEFDEGTILHHPRAGKQRVIGAKGTGQGMEPVQ